METQITDKHHPAPTRQGRVFRPHHRNRARTAAVLGGAVIWRMVEELALSASLVLACALQM
jgi:hypothetical protein